MAKQNKINKKRAKRRARKFVERQDYRQGGRGAFQRGGLKGMAEEVRENIVKEDPKEQTQQPVTEAPQPVEEAPVMPLSPAPGQPQAIITPRIPPGEEELKPIKSPEFPTGEGLGTPKRTSTRTC